MKYLSGSVEHLDDSAKLGFMNPPHLLFFLLIFKYILVLSSFKKEKKKNSSLWNLTCFLLCVIPTRIPDHLARVACVRFLHSEASLPPLSQLASL